MKPYTPAHCFGIEMDSGGQGSYIVERYAIRINADRALEDFRRSNPEHSYRLIMILEEYN